MEKMPTEEEAIEAAALGLDPRSRARLAGKLLASLDELTEAESDAMWVAEAERRDDDVEAASASTRPAADVLRDARARLR